MSVSEVFSGLVDLIVELLPSSPFTGLAERFANLPGISYLNWFFPVGECLVVLTAWLSAYAVFLVYSVIMRWIKLIGD